MILRVAIQKSTGKLFQWETCATVSKDMPAKDIHLKDVANGFGVSPSDVTICSITCTQDEVEAYRAGLVAGSATLPSEKTPREVVAAPKPEPPPKSRLELLEERVAVLEEKLK